MAEPETDGRGVVRLLSKARSCTTKRRHKNRASATRQLSWMRRHRGKRPGELEVYHWLHCRGYHIGHVLAGR